MSGSVLIVDDSITVRMDLVEAFDAAGFTTHPCASIAETRETISRCTIDIIVLDVLLPDGDGVDLIAELRASPGTSHARVLMLSTEAEVADRIRALHTGADEYFGKPYDRASIVSRAREFLRVRASAAEDKRPTVLIIDDSVTYREQLRSSLEAAGYLVLTAESGEEGLRVAADRRPGAILVDGVLPGIDGCTVIRRVRLDSALRSVPCVLLTGSESRGGELRALDSGADAFVRKEEDLDVILARIATVLRHAQVAVAAGEPESLLAPKRILAVDDSITYLHATAASLREDGYDVVLAHSGEQALELLAIQRVDCILLDMVMPGLSGQETCRRIKSVQGVRETPVIMLTALENRLAMIDGLSAGADDYIAKSGEFDVLRARVRAQIRRRVFEDEHRRLRDELLQREIEASEARAARDLAEARAALVEELERKNKELESFSYSVSHDLRSPLRAIDGFSQALLEDYGDKLDEQGRDNLHRVRAAAQRMGELIDDLLALSRVGRSQLRREPIDLAPIARSIAEDLRHGEPGREVEIRIESPLEVEGDARLLRILLENLLGNAWKFTSRTPAARIEVGRTTRDGTITTFVRDNGAGFDLKFATRLFSPFQRLHKQSEFPGTGIGLATVARIADRHGGRVWIDAAVDKGATVYFTVQHSTKVAGRT